VVVGVFLPPPEAVSGVFLPPPEAVSGIFPLPQQVEAEFFSPIQEAQKVQVEAKEKKALAIETANTPTPAQRSTVESNLSARDGASLAAVCPVIFPT
jgi:hypothetical protein